MVADVLELGEILLEARSLIGRGHWLKWLDDLGLSEDMARRFMDVSEMSQSRNLRDWGQQIPLSALYNSRDRAHQKKSVTRSSRDARRARRFRSLTSSVSSRRRALSMR